VKIDIPFFISMEYQQLLVASAVINALADFLDITPKEIIHATTLMPTKKDMFKEFKNRYNIDTNSIVYISKFRYLSNDFICKYYRLLNWNHVSRFQNLSETMIKKFKNYVNWKSISRYQKLSEQFIDIYYNNVKWKNISRYQQLSETFIRDHRHQVDWELIYKHQKLSNDFQEEFRDKVSK
jgi:hypothetical protein